MGLPVLPVRLQVWMTGAKPQPRSSSSSGSAADDAPLTTATSGGGSGLSLLYDEDYERHIECAWDTRTVKQVGALHMLEKIKADPRVTGL